MEILTEKWSGAINTVTLGAQPKDGGTRDSIIKIGGEKALPVLFNEGEIPNKPAVAMEILDVEPVDWPDVLKNPFGASLKDPVKWAVKCAADFKADLLCVSIEGAHPDSGNRKASDIVPLVRDIAQAVKKPLIILGSGDHEKDNDILPKVSEALKGERCLIGDAIDKNYKTLTASVIADGHNIIAESPIDVNMAKQINIMINEMGLDLDRIVINPTIGGLGYGIEYSYSIMERARLAALNGDKMLAMPFVCFVGQEAWKAKEAKAENVEHPEWGDINFRGPMWEIQTAIAVMLAGADLLVMRHPKAAEKVKEYIDKLFEHDGVS